MVFIADLTELLPLKCNHFTFFVECIKEVSSSEFTGRQQKEVNKNLGLVVSST